MKLHEAEQIRLRLQESECFNANLGEIGLIWGVWVKLHEAEQIFVRLQGSD